MYEAISLAIIRGIKRRFPISKSIESIESIEHHYPGTSAKPTQLIEERLSTCKFDLQRYKPWLLCQTQIFITSYTHTAHLCLPCLPVTPPNHSLSSRSKDDRRDTTSDVRRWTMSNVAVGAGPSETNAPPVPRLSPRRPPSPPTLRWVGNTESRDAHAVSQENHGVSHARNPPNWPDLAKNMSIDVRKNGCPIL